ncbi:hypothetical protein Tco_0474167 [Tanacetum coccineum]
MVRLGAKYCFTAVVDILLNPHFRKHRGSESSGTRMGQLDSGRFHLIADFSPPPVLHSSPLLIPTKVGGYFPFLCYMGCHIDGFIAMAAHTYVLIQGGPVTGLTADSIVAANTVAEVALRLVRYGRLTTLLLHMTPEWLKTLLVVN